MVPHVLAALGRTHDPANVERFYSEARAAAALDHPNIVHAYDVACDKGTHFLVLEYIDGDEVPSLIDELPVGHVSPGTTVALWFQAYSGAWTAEGPAA